MYFDNNPIYKLDILSQSFTKEKTQNISKNINISNQKLCEFL